MEARAAKTSERPRETVPADQETSTSVPCPTCGETVEVVTTAGGGIPVSVRHKDTEPKERRSASEDPDGALDPDRHIHSLDLWHCPNCLRHLVIGYGGSAFIRLKQSEDTPEAKEKIVKEQEDKKRRDEERARRRAEQLPVENDPVGLGGLPPAEEDSVPPYNYAETARRDKEMDELRASRDRLERMEREDDERRTREERERGERGEKPSSPAPKTPEQQAEANQLKPEADRSAAGQAPGGMVSTKSPAK